MVKTYPRFTVGSTAELEGVGLHSATPTRVLIHPGESGFRFLHNSQVIDALPSNVKSTNRCTQLGSVSTVEHVLSALAGLGYTDADIEVIGDELPAANGCSAPYVEALRAVGQAACGTLEVEGPFARVYFVEEGKPFKYAVGLGEGFWRCDFELGNSFVGTQEFELVWTPEHYARQVAPARTFVLEHEIEAAKALGLGKGLDEDSCFGIGASAYLGKTRFPDEPVRHKLLDMIGDLALTGIPIAHLDVIGHWTGHESNVALAAKILSQVKIQRQV